MKKLAVMLAIGGTFVLGSAAASQAAASVSLKFPITMEVFVPCANGGAGETVLLHEQLNLIAADTFTPKLESFSFIALAKGTGTGEITGATYHFSEASASHYTAPLIDPGLGVQGSQPTAQSIRTVESTTSISYRIIGQGPGNNFLVHQLLHVTMDLTDFSISASVDKLSVECK